MAMAPQAVVATEHSAIGLSGEFSLPGAEGFAQKLADAYRAKCPDVVLSTMKNGGPDLHVVVEGVRAHPTTYRVEPLQDGTALYRFRGPIPGYREGPVELVAIVDGRNEEKDGRKITRLDKHPELVFPYASYEDGKGKRKTCKISFPNVTKESMEETYAKMAAELTR